jgi:hypothetical protein
MSPEFLEALKIVEEYDRQRPQSVVEYRLYYDQQGYVTGFCETDHPADTNYITIANPDVFFKNNTQLMRVVDGQLKILDAHPKSVLGLRVSDCGQPTVRGIAALALEPNEIYNDIIYYDRKTNS